MNKVTETVVRLNDILTLGILAQGIIPADQRDHGAAGVHAGPGIAERMRRSVYGFIYTQGLRDTEEITAKIYGRAIRDLDEHEVHHLLGLLRQEAPHFFRLLRADVCALYLSDPGVWQRIGFSGPSAQVGGHPDFNLPQGRAV